MKKVLTALACTLLTASPAIALANSACQDTRLKIYNEATYINDKGKEVGVDLKVQSINYKTGDLSHIKEGDTIKYGDMIDAKVNTQHNQSYGDITFEFPFVEDEKEPFLGEDPNDRKKFKISYGYDPTLTFLSCNKKVFDASKSATKKYKQTLDEHTNSYHVTIERK